MSETHKIDSELKRDAIYAGIWTRLCVEIRARADGERLEDYAERRPNRRGSNAMLAGYLDEDIGLLTAARRRLRLVRDTPIGSEVVVDDVERFMPVALKQDPDESEQGEWLYAPSEVKEAADQHPGAVIRIRRSGADL